MKVRTIEKPDSLDREALRALCASPGWRLLVEQGIALAIKQNQAALEQEPSWDNVRYRQGFLAGLRCALDLPGVLAQRIADGARRNAAHASAIGSWADAQRRQPTKEQP